MGFPVGPLHRVARLDSAFVVRHWRDMLRTFSAALALALPTALTAAVGPETTLVVVNGDSPASLAVANAWVDLRKIPLDHVVVLHGIPTDTYCHRPEFVKTILAPLCAAVRGRGLAGEIEVVAYAPDFPLQIANDLPEPPAREVGWFGSLTGMTALGGLVLAGAGDWTSLRSSLDYAVPGGVVVQPIVPRSLVKVYKTVEDCFAAKDYAGAERKLLDLDRQIPGSADFLYDLACAQARLHKTPEALATLARAVAAGFTDGKWIAKDDDLTSLHGQAQFDAIITGLKDFAITAPESLPLDNHPQWLAEDGEAGSHPSLGATSATPATACAVLPTVLLGQCSGDGLSIPLTIADLARAAGADGTHPTGTIYCEKNGDIRSSTRAWAFDALKKTLTAAHIAAVVEDGVLPRNQPAVAGAVIGIADFNWKWSGSTIVPGAICEHLTSLGGQMWPGASQTHLSAWLRAGAAGSSGTVDEPLALQAKFPSPFIQSHYARGLTLVEAFYRAVEAPYQLLIVGDPLCAPWARPVAMENIDDAHAPAGAGIRTVEVWLDGHRSATVAPGAALPDFGPLAAGEHDLRLVCLPTDVHAQPARVLRTFTVAGAVPRVQAPDTVAIDGTFQVQADFTTASATAAAGIHLRLRAAGGTMADIPGTDGLLAVPAGQLGLGPVAVMVEAVADGAVIAQTRCAVSVTPPATLPALQWPEVRMPHPRVTVDGVDRIVASACEGDAWLRETGMDTRAGTVEAWFRMGHDGLWQAQWLGRRVANVAVDGEGPVACGDSHWLLRSLAAGWHRVRFAINPGPGACSLRIGDDGTWPLSARNCCHGARDIQVPFPGADR
jgi:hypothetical protein